MNTEFDVLLVDDDRAVRESLVMLLKSHDLLVKAFSSSQEFIETYEEVNNSACLILDIGMPGLNGLEVQEVLIKKNNKMPIIFITGHGDESLSQRALSAGAFGFIEKPFKADVLLDRVNEAIALSSQV